MKPALRHWLELRAASVAGGIVSAPAAPRDPSPLSLVPVGHWPLRAVEAARALASPDPRCCRVVRCLPTRGAPTAPCGGRAPRNAAHWGRAVRKLGPPRVRLEPCTPPPAPSVERPYFAGVTFGSASLLSPPPSDNLTGLSDSDQRVKLPISWKPVDFVQTQALLLEAVFLGLVSRSLKTEGRNWDTDVFLFKSNLL